MPTTIRALIPAILFIAGCDGVDDSPEAAPVLVGDRAQELAAEAGVAADELAARRPADDGSADERPADEVLGDVALLAPSEQAYCQPYDFQECENTCGMFGEYCFVCMIADDGFPVFFCHSNTPKKW